ncbi:MAG TPA: 30S ribosomal protein S20 [Candidatus Krumholzibacteria bacterium]|nr:30S ribosomal protein S20 [Candidatus Krumholzibacteria bacterium]
MPHHKQFVKTLRRDAKRRLVNRSKRARLRHALREFRALQDASAARTAFPQIEAIIDKSAKTRLIHPRTASRLKSRLAVSMQRLRAA